MLAETLSFWKECLGPLPLLAGFMLCVALAAYAQTITGFAFGLILLSLSAAFDLASVSDAANAAMLLSLVNAFSYFRTERKAPPWQLMRPAILTSLAFIVLGVMLLHWLSTHAAQWLKVVLGTTIVACAVALIAHKTPRPTLSSAKGFAIAGAFSGLLGGLFGTSGPPIVYQLYRQPLESEVIRRALLLMFTCNSCFRLVLVTATGGFTLRAGLLALLAFPIVHVVTTWTVRHPPRLSRQALQVGVAVLLIASGVMLFGSGLQASLR